MLTHDSAALPFGCTKLVFVTPQKGFLVARSRLSHAELVASVSPDVPDEDVESVIVAPRQEAAATLEFAKSVAMGLTDTPPWLHSHYLYDDEGSRLFEEICAQPEYYLTQSEAGILERESKRIAELTGSLTLIELGSGNSVKTDYLLSSYGAAHSAVRYVPVDISDAILHQAKDEILKRHDNVTVTGIADTYEHAFPLFKEFSPAMMLFLGSSLGNLDQREADKFWVNVSTALSPGDFVLLGMDLVKDVSTLNAAYNDAAGMTAAFTKNLFARINRELGASIDLDAVEHVARYNDEWQRVEISARFLEAQEVYLEPLDRTIPIARDAKVMTEISRKYDLDKATEYLRCFDFRVREVFTDEQGWFAVLLLEKC